VKVDIKGGRELEAKLRELGNKVTARAVGRRALLKAAEPIRDTAKRLAPDDPATGAGQYLPESIKVAPGRRNKGDRTWALVGIDASVDPAQDKPRQGGGTYRDPGVAGVSVIQEFGAPAANVPPHPFMRPSWEHHKAATPQRIVDELGPEIEKAAQRIARKRARA
jgi:HK97 gp10 family phage protein